MRDGKAGERIRETTDEMIEEELTIKAQEEEVETAMKKVIKNWIGIEKDHLLVEIIHRLLISHQVCTNFSA